MRTTRSSVGSETVVAAVMTWGSEGEELASVQLLLLLLELRELAGARPPGFCGRPGTWPRRHQCCCWWWENPTWWQGCAARPNSCSRSVMICPVRRLTGRVQRGQQERYRVGQWSAWRHQIGSILFDKREMDFCQALRSFKRSRRLFSL